MKSFFLKKKKTKTNHHNMFTNLKPMIAGKNLHLKIFFVLN